MELGLRRVADAAGVNYSYLFRVEDGVHIPSDDFLLKLAKLYEITLEEKLNLLMIAHGSQLHEVLKDAYNEEPKVLETVFFRKAKNK